MLLFTYILREYLKYVLGTVVLCLFLFVLFDFIHKTTRYLSIYNPSTVDLLKFYLFQIPNLIIQALPIASLLGSVISMVLLSRTNEITAMRAAGLGPLLIGLPIAIGASGLCLLSILIGEVVQPVSARKMHFIQDVKIEKQEESQAVNGVRWVRKGASFFNYRDYDPGSAYITGIKIIELGSGFRPKRSIEAGRARYNGRDRNWQLESARVSHFWPNGTISNSEDFESLSVDIPLDPGKLKKERRLPNELSLGELSEAVERGSGSGVDIIGLAVDRQVKFAFHFASLVVALIGLKFSFKSERSMETAKGILLAIAVGMSYWFILNAFRALGRRALMPPIVAGWSANFIIVLISSFEIFRARKG